MITHSFDKVIADICDIELASLLRSYKYTVYGGHTVALEGHKGLLRYSKDCVVFLLADGKLTVNGNNLCLRNLSKRTVIISGDKVSVEVSR